MGPLRRRDSCCRQVRDAGRAAGDRLAAIPWASAHQLVHGHFWDNNVLFNADSIVLILDLDFMAERERRQVLDRMLIFGRRHLEKVLAEYIDHYNHARPHQGIEQRRPCEPADVIPLPTGQITRRDRLGGVLREYNRAAA